MASPTGSIRTTKRENDYPRFPASPRSHQRQELNDLNGASSGIPIPRMPSSSHSTPSIQTTGLSTIGEGMTSSSSSFHTVIPITTTRSPSGSSLSSHRSHPYSRRPSFPNAPSPQDFQPSSRPSTRDLPKIQLPPPGSSTSLKFESDERNVAPLSNLVIQSPSDRPPVHRSTSMSSNRSIQLPPLHAISGSSSMPQYSPGTAHSHGTRPPSPSMSTEPSPNMYPLRPSYSYGQYSPPEHSPMERTRPVDHYARAASRHPQDVHAYEYDHHSAPAGRIAAPVGGPARQTQYDPYTEQERAVHSSHRRVSPTKYHEAPASPLRSVPPELRGPGPIHDGRYYSSGRYDDDPMRSRSQSYSSVSMRGATDMNPPGDGNSGQNRRLAHLMSEQKRRE
jgi:hypothetical protein